VLPGSWENKKCGRFQFDSESCWIESRLSVSESYSAFLRAGREEGAVDLKLPGLPAVELL
jgi:hypothetical protein